MDLQFDVKVAGMDLVHTNEDETLLAMGGIISERLKQRYSSGLGARDALPAPKAGGQPGIASGTMFNSVAVTISQRRKDKYAVVFPSGARPEDENVESKKSAARAKTRALRAAMSIALTFARIGGAQTITLADTNGKAKQVGIDAFTRKRPTKSGQIFKLSRFQVRTADTNAALAGILSVPPKDKRGINGGRGVYRIFVGTPEYRALAAQQARQVAQFVLQVKGPPK